jgi:hypothetical protein
MQHDFTPYESGDEYAVREPAGSASTRRGERTAAFVIGCPFRGVWVVERRERAGQLLKYARIDPGQRGKRNRE